MSSAPTPFDAPHAAPSRPDRLVRRARWALAFALAPVAAWALGLAVAFTLDVIWPLGVLLGLSALLAGVGLVLGGQAAWKILAVGGLGAAGAATSIGAVLLSLVTTPLGALAAVLATFGFTRGRQLRRRGKLVFAELGPDAAGWLPPPEATAPAPAEVADAWRHNGLTEHASVAAFGKVAAELVALGAPARLIEAAYADALDEHRHTSLCFGLARDLDGRALAPGPFPAVSTVRGARGPRAVRLASLAVESLVDGALNEGVSARVVAGLARTCAEPRIRAVLDEIARDEARHASHGFHVMAWCLEAGGAPVAAALQGALRALPDRPGPMPYDLPGAEPWGLPSPKRVAEAYGVVLTRLRARAERLLSKTTQA